MVQWVKNPIAVAWVATEVQVRSPSLVQWVKGYTVAAVLLQLRFSLWPSNFHMPWVQPLEKKKGYKIRYSHPLTPNRKTKASG